jgi:hypothetical protein
MQTKQELIQKSSSASFAAVAQILVVGIHVRSE